MSSARSLALLGNAVALALICLLCGAGDVLFADADRARAARVPAEPATARLSPSPAPPGSTAPAPAPVTLAPVLLVVIDGLRLDTSLDARTMPALAELARLGRRTELEMEALVPSTIAALQAMVEGRRVAPAAALHDFGASPAPGGGTLERLAAAGGRTLVAGTHLWEGLYGRFLEPGLAVPGLPDAASDARVLAAALAALDADPADRPELVVAHFGALDAAGHRYGGASGPYRGVAARIDAAADALARRALADGRDVVLVSDHGTTDRGGHAGGEPVVRRVPLVVAGSRAARAADALDPTLQRHLPELLDAMLGLMSPGAADRPGADPVAASIGAATLVRLTLAALACLAALAIVTARARLVADARASTALSAAVWIVIVAAVVAGPSLAAGLGALALSGVAVMGLRRASTHGSPHGSPHGSSRGALACTVCGAAFAALGMMDAALGTVVAGPALMAVAAALALLACAPRTGRIAMRRHRAGWMSFADVVRIALVGATLLAGFALGGPAANEAFALAGLTALALLGGAVTGLARRPLAAGLALALVPAALARIAGDTASLSSIDVALAHRMADSPLGLGAAVATAVARLAILPVATVLGHALVRGLHCDTVPKHAPQRTFEALAAAHLGAGFAFAVALAVGPAPADPTASAEAATVGVPLAAAGLGGLLRELDAVVWLWLTAAATLGLGPLEGRRRALPAADRRTGGA